MAFHRISALSGHIEGNEPAKDSVAQKLSGKATQLFQKSAAGAFQAEWPTVSVDCRGKHTEMDILIRTVKPVKVLLNTISSAKDKEEALLEWAGDKEIQKLMERYCLGPVFGGFPI